MPAPDNPPCQKSLSKEHEHELLSGSGISSKVVAARGYYTATRPSEVPEVFSKRQQRLGLVVPLHSPDGESIGYQLKPKKPLSKGPKYVNPAGSRNVLDVNPLMLCALRNTAIPLWITEGAKKVDALASWGRCAIGLSGVWNWLLKGGDPLPCWRHVPLQGRRVYVAFDSDCRTNRNVQSALARLVTFLKDQGAAVLVVDIPHEGDGKTAIDDYLAAGGNLEELERSAHPYSPTDIATERLTRNEKLRAAISSLWSRWREREYRTTGDYTDRSIMRALIREAEQCGKLAKDGVRVKMGQRALALKAGVSTVAPSRSIPRLEKSGYLRRDNKGRKADEPGAFILLFGATEGARYCRHSGEKGAPKEKVKGEGEERKTLPTTTSSVPADYSSACTTEEVAELRWPTIRFREEKDELGRVARVGDYVARIGKKSAAILEHLVESGGVASMPELMKRFASPKERPRDFKRRTLGMLTESPAIILIEGDLVTLTHGWQAALEGARLRTDEQGDYRRQEQKHARQWEAFRRRGEHPADLEPAEPEMPQEGDLREPWSRPDRRRRRRRLRERPGRRPQRHSRALSWLTPRAPEPNLSKPTPAQEAPAMVAMHPQANSPAEDWHSHRLDCECDQCLYPEPKYARPYRGSGVRCG